MKTLMLQDHVYQLVRKLIYKIVHRFQRRYGGDFEELLSEAHLHYTRSIHKFHRRPTDKYKFSSHVYINVWNGLLDSWRTQRNRQNKLARCLDYDLGSAIESNRFDFDKFCADLSPDAETIVRHIPILAPNKQNKMWAVTEHFLDLGWSAARIVDSFHEILEALS